MRHLPENVIWTGERCAAEAVPLQSRAQQFAVATHTGQHQDSELWIRFTHGGGPWASVPALFAIADVTRRSGKHAFKLPQWTAYGNAIFRDDQLADGALVGAAAALHDGDCLA